MDATYQEVYSTTQADFEAFLQAYTWLSLAVCDDCEMHHQSLSALHLDVLDGQPVAVACDGYRMHITWKLSGLFGRYAVNVPGSKSTIIPMPDTSPNAPASKWYDITESFLLVSGQTPLLVDADELSHRWLRFYDAEDDMDEMAVCEMSLEYDAFGHLLTFSLAKESFEIPAQGGAGDWKFQLQPHFFDAALSGMYTNPLELRVNTEAVVLGVGTPGERFAVIKGMKQP